jgi:hypothetical protein
MVGAGVTILAAQGVPAWSSRQQQRIEAGNSVRRSRIVAGKTENNISRRERLFEVDVCLYFGGFQLKSPRRQTVKQMFTLELT